MQTALPTFRYHPDPISTGAITPSPEACERCQERRGFIYSGPTYAVDEIESLCPWCIADGTAADAFGAEFCTIDGAPDDVPASVKDEIVRRTPGFAGWQQERWLFHCSDGAEFRGRVGYQDVETLPEVIESILEGGWDLNAIRSMSADGDLTGYLFRCRHCGTSLAYADCS